MLLAFCCFQRPLPSVQILNNIFMVFNVVLNCLKHSHFWKSSKTNKYLKIMYVKLIYTTRYKQLKMRHTCIFSISTENILGLPWWLSGKEFACNGRDARDMGFIPGLGSSPEGMTGEATGHEVTKSWTQLKWPNPEHIQHIKLEEPGYYNKRSKIWPVHYICVFWKMTKYTA